MTAPPLPQMTTKQHLEVIVGLDHPLHPYETQRAILTRLDDLVRDLTRYRDQKSSDGTGSVPEMAESAAIAALLSIAAGWREEARTRLSRRKGYDDLTRLGGGTP